MSATVLIGTGISASAFSNQFKGDLEIHDKASRVGGRLCARNYKEYIIQYGAQYATSSSSIFDGYLVKAGAINQTASIYIEEKNKYEDKKIWTHEKGIQFIVDYGFLNRKLNFNSEVIKINQKNNSINLKNKIVFENCSFGYEEGNNIFENLNFEFCIGDKIGVIGNSGAGKTTFIYLIMGLLKLENLKIIVLVFHLQSPKVTIT